MTKDEKSGARDASHDANARLAFQILDDELLRVTRTQSTMPREQNLEVCCQNSFQKLVLLASNQFVHNHDDASEQS